MRKSTLSSLIVVAMIALCLGSVASNAESARMHVYAPTSLSGQAVATASSVLWDDGTLPMIESPAPAANGAERAMAQAAEAAGQAVSEIEMPFFSFGGATSAE